MTVHCVYVFKGYQTGFVNHDHTLCVCLQVIIQDLCIMTVHCLYVFAGYYTGSVYHDSTLCVCLQVIIQDL